MEEARDNPFRKWVEKTYIPTGVVYYPDDSVVETVLERLGITLQQLEKLHATWRAVHIESAFVYLWCQKDFEYDKDSGTVKHMDTLFKVVSSVRKDIHLRVPKILLFRAIKGWIGTPALNKYLVRACREEDPNAYNPFNIFIKRGNRNILPDVDYLPELYEELGVKSFEELHISGTGDYKKILEEDAPNFGFSLTVKLYGENVAITWGTKEANYVERFPREMIEKLRRVVVRNSGQMPLSWTKEIFQELVSKGLKGKDLISLCISDSHFNARCNYNDQQLFKDRLLSEFDVNWYNDHHNFQTPRELYIQMHTYYEKMIGITRADGSFEFYDVLEMKEGKPAPYHRDYSVLSVLVPNQNMFKTDNDQLIIVFFPQAPQFSFYISGSGHLKGSNIMIIDSLSIFGAEKIEQILGKESLLKSAETFLKHFLRDGERHAQSGYPLGEKWKDLIPVEGRARVILLKSPYDKEH